MAKSSRKAAKAAKATKSPKAQSARPSVASARRPRKAAPLSDSAIARAQAREWADGARTGSARTAAIHAERLAAAMAGGDRRLAEFCMELMADLPTPVLFAIGREHLGHGAQERRWVLAQTLALAFQKKPLVETADLAERCLQQALALLGSARHAGRRGRGRDGNADAAENRPADPFLAQAILWLEAMNGSAIWLQPTERMKLLAQKISAAASPLPAADQDNLRTVLLRLIAALPELWAEELMIDALGRSPWTAFAAIEALRGHPGPRIDVALWSALNGLPGSASPIIVKALYGALIERQPVDLLPELWARLADCPPPRLALHVALVAACAQRQPALAAQVARSAPGDAALKRLFAIPAADGAFAAWHACEIIARVGAAEHADAMAALARRFVGVDGFDMVAFACSRTLRQWVGPDKARKLLKARIGDAFRIPGDA